MAGFPCCCDVVPQTCCPLHPVSAVVCARLTTACVLFDGIVFPVTFKPNPPFGGSWIGTFRESLLGGDIDARIEMQCGPPWKFLGSAIDLKSYIRWLKKDWPPPPACEWWTDPTEGGLCPSAPAGSRPTGWDGKSCHKDPATGRIEYYPTNCLTCPPGMVQNAGSGTFYVVCIPCSAALSVNFFGDADSAVCDPLAVVRNKLITGPTDTSPTSNCRTGPLPCVGDTPISLTVENCPDPATAARAVAASEMREKRRMTFDEMALARSRCQQAKAAGLPCNEFTQ